MKNKKHLVYVSQSLLSSNKANSVHVINMTSALAKYCNVTLIHAYQLKDPNLNRKIFSDFGKNIDVFLKGLYWKNIPGYAVIYSFKAVLYLCFGIKNKVDIVYCRCMYSAFLLSMLGFYKIIYESHALPRTKLHVYLERKIFQAKSTSRIILITQELLKSYEVKFGKNFCSEKVSIFPDGANEIDKELSLGSIALRNIVLKGSYIFYGGSLLPGKGVETILKIASKAKNIEFVIAGGDSNSVEKLKGISTRNVTFLGKVQYKEMMVLQASARILLLPNEPIVLTDSGRVNIGGWTSPLKMFEYMASGRPIVSSDLSVLKEVLVDNYNALLVCYDAIDEWIIAIEKILSDNHLEKFLGDNAKRDLSANYTWDKRALRISRLWKNDAKGK
jgi:glycosyltransferase involved in cell wall biosynthesis